MIVEEVLDRLPGAAKCASGWHAKCPAHDDARDSLSIANGAEGRILLHCHAGCTTDAICAALGIRVADLFPAKPNSSKSRSRIDVTYDYCDEAGRLIFQVCRYVPKDFRQRKPDASAPDGWVWKTAGLRQVPYRLPELLAAVSNKRPVYICEGEKDCEALMAAGFAATCNPGGADKWKDDFAHYFNGAEVVIVADKDAAGRRHAQKVAENLHGVARVVRVIELPDLEGRSVNDAADFFAAGGDAAQLDEIAQNASIWEPMPMIERPTDAASDFERATAEMRKNIIALLTSRQKPDWIRNEIAKLVVAALAKAGHFYYHADLKDFTSAMYFDANRKRLSRIRSDEFVAWLSEWVSINRAEGHFKFIQSAVETAALSSPHTMGILPEAFWATRGGKGIYLSNGDGQAVRITPDRVELVNNGTDGVLFAAGKTLLPWQITTPRDPFETCSLFRHVHCAASHGKHLLQLWIYSLLTNPRTKPPLCLAGEVGSGKTRTIKGVTELLGVPFVAQKVEEDAESHFWPCINEGGIYCMDNADTKCRWLPDALANAATDGCSQRRRLYTNAETVTLRPRAWLAITTANPTFASDAGLADRLLLVRMNRHNGITSDAHLSEEIAANRDAALSHIAETLSHALADNAPTTTGLNARHPDFAAFAVKIGGALGIAEQALHALQAAEADKSTFCLENDVIGAALLTYLNQAGGFEGTAVTLAKHLAAIDPELERSLSAKRLGKRLSSIWPHLQNSFEICDKHPDRNGITVFKFSNSRGVCGVSNGL